MRLIPAYLLVALAAPLAAQTHLADSSGVFLGIGTTYQSSTGLTGLGGSVGYRHDNGVDYSAGFQLRSSRRLTPGTGSLVSSFGAGLGYTADIGSGLNLRLEGAAGIENYAHSAQSEDRFLGVDGSNFQVDLRANVQRPVRVIGSFRLHPTLGAYAHARQDLRSRATGLEEDWRPTLYDPLDAGLEVGLPISFRLLGSDVSIPLVYRQSFMGNELVTYGPTWGPSGGIRINF